jgi:hypothetical protein
VTTLLPEPHDVVGKVPTISKASLEKGDKKDKKEKKDKKKKEGDAKTDEATATSTA